MQHCNMFYDTHKKRHTVNEVEDPGLLGCEAM